MALSFGFHRPGVTRHRALRSSDFPPVRTWALTGGRLDFLSRRAQSAACCRGMQEEAALKPKNQRQAAASAGIFPPMPLYLYTCRDCGADLEVLHPVDKTVERCGLDCKRRDQGAFGKGTIAKLPSAPHIGKQSARGGSPAEADPLARVMAGDPGREALRQKALEQLGSDTVTEKELDRLREGGMTVYRKSGKGRWEKDGGDAAAPGVIEPTDTE